MNEEIKKRLKWIKEDDTLIVREIQDSATLCKLLRINAHLKFIYEILLRNKLVPVEMENPEKNSNKI